MRSVLPCGRSSCGSGHQEMLPPNGGSRLHGAIAEIAFLGMCTQFRVETRVGRLVSYPLADERLGTLEVGSVVEFA